MLVPKQSYYFDIIILLSSIKNTKVKFRLSKGLSQSFRVTRCREGVQNWLLNEHSVEWFCPQFPDIAQYILLLREQSASHVHRCRLL